MKSYDKILKMNSTFINSHVLVSKMNSSKKHNNKKIEVNQAI